MAAKPVFLIRREIEVGKRHLSHLCTESCRLANAANDVGHIHCVCLCSMLNASLHSLSRHSFYTPLLHANFLSDTDFMLLSKTLTQ